MGFRLAINENSQKAAGIQVTVADNLPKLIRAVIDNGELKHFDY